MRRKVLAILIENMSLFVSGEKMSRELNITRAAVWKHIKALESDGYIIEKSHGKGYRLSCTPDKIDESIVCELENNVLVGKTLETHSIIDSTNVRAKKLALEGAPEGTIIVSDVQTAGRGRMDRKWLSPDKKGLWMSVILKPDVSPERGTELTILAACAIVKTLRENFEFDTGLKWPNDVIVNGKKICGILSEIQADPDRINAIIVGIGLNVNLLEDDFPTEIRNISTSIFLETHTLYSRRELFVSLVKKLDALYCEYNVKKSIDFLMDYYKSCLLTLGKKVQVIEKTASYEAFAYDIHNDGSLLVRLRDGTEKRIFSADVSIRGEQQYV